jgi:hypothetical protein
VGGIDLLSGIVLGVVWGFILVVREWQTRAKVGYDTGIRGTAEIIRGKLHEASGKELERIAQTIVRGTFAGKDVGPQCLAILRLPGVNGALLITSSNSASLPNDVIWPILRNRAGFGLPGEQRSPSRRRCCREATWEASRDSWKIEARPERKLYQRAIGPERL